MNRLSVLAMILWCLGTGLAACGGDDAKAPISGPVVLIGDKDRLKAMVDDIWPGIHEGSGFVTASGLTGGLRMVTLLNFMDPGSVEFRLSAHVLEVPSDTSPDQVQLLIGKVMREGMAMSDWHATRDGSETFSLGGSPTDFERYAVVATSQDRTTADMEMYLLSRVVEDQRAILAITGHVNSFERPATAQNLVAFLDSIQGV